MSKSTNEVLDIIISLVKAVKKDESLVSVDENGKEIVLNDTKYLLGQTLRQYRLSSEKFLVSKRAKEKWDSLTSKNIFDYWYKKKVECDLADNVVVREYKGNSNKYTERVLKKKDTFIYRDVFHDEHIVSISVVINELCACENLTYENVKKILDKMYICKILKEEDRNIKIKHKRDIDIEKNLDIYNKANIEIIR